jgi:ABC-type glycerol-3-phosphate transport system permease component
MKQFMGQIPESMIEAAKLDGASHLRICWQIVMPNVKPAWLTLMIFAFQGAWQITGYLFVYSEQLKPIPIVMQQIAAAGIARTGVSSAVSLIMMLVPVAVFVSSQSNVIETMSTSGMKD